MIYAQDFLTWLLIATFIFSALNFGMLFIIGLNDRVWLLSQTTKSAYTYALSYRFTCISCSYTCHISRAGRPKPNP